MTTLQKTMLDPTSEIVLQRIAWHALTAWEAKHSDEGHISLAYSVATAIHEHLDNRKEYDDGPV